MLGDPNIFYKKRGIKLNTEIAEKWVTALESGEYTQGIGVLQQNGKYCCLGVLCELAVKEGIIQPPTPDMDDTYQYGSHQTWSSETLPDEVIDWAQMISNEGLISLNYDDKSYSSLVDMNDSGVSFKQIAEKIREHKDIL
jgi:hypothetical protein